MTIDRSARDRVHPPVGLTAHEAAERLRRDGPNEVPRSRGPSAVLRLVQQMTHLFALMLWVAAGLALLAGMPELTLAIIAVVLVNGVFAFAQEHRADRATERLQALVPQAARVHRDGHLITVPAREVVRGDLVVLTAGDRVCADLTLLTGHELAVDESLLTGESRAVHPVDGAGLSCGTVLLEGEAEAVVVETGGQTRLAAIAALSMRTVRRPSPLTRQLHRVVLVISIVAVATGTGLMLVATALGMPLALSFLFAVGVTVALVPEGLMPTVTLALALGAQTMAGQHALVRRLDAVEALGATTVICTDKTGTLTLNQMSVVRLWTPDDGPVTVPGSGYDPTEPLTDLPETAEDLAVAAASCVRGMVAPAADGSGWVPHGDPLEVALDVLSRRVGVGPGSRPVERRLPYTAQRRRSSVVVAGRGPGSAAGRVVVLGAPEAVLPVTTDPATADEARLVLDELAGRGLRVLAVAARPAPDGWVGLDALTLESGLTLLGLVALEDPPRPDVAESVRRCRAAGLRVVMLTGDHPATAMAVAREAGLVDPTGNVLEGDTLPDDDAELVRLLLAPDGAVVARVSPEDKLRIALALRDHGQVVAMTGDGVNDAPALRAADVGVAMGASGTDAAREAADLVLLDDHFATVVSAVELGRATSANIRRFLTFHLTDNVAELAPFAAWALTAGQLPLAIGVLQVLALDLGTDMLPALALGTEPPNPNTLRGPVRRDTLIDRAVTVRAFGVLGPAEASGALLTFVAVLVAGGWTWAAVPPTALLATASGSAFAAIAVGQLANAVACRSATRPAWRTGLRGNRLLRWALGVEAVVCAALLGIPPVADVLGGSWPNAVGWAGAAATGLLVVLADAGHKHLRGRRRAAPQVSGPASGQVRGDGAAAGPR